MPALDIGYNIPLIVQMIADTCQSIQRYGRFFLEFSPEVNSYRGWAIFA